MLTVLTVLVQDKPLAGSQCYLAYTFPACFYEQFFSAYRVVWWISMFPDPSGCIAANGHHSWLSANLRNRLLAFHEKISAPFIAINLLFM